MNNIVLIGYRCTGKSTVARALAKMLEIPAVDTDEIVQRLTGLSITRMVAEGGWELFRTYERDVIADVVRKERNVIATGGGVVEDENNRRLLSEGNMIIWLTADSRTISKRMVIDGKSEEERPPLSNDPLVDEIDRILEKRTPLYREMADLVIDTTVAAADETAGKIVEHMERERK